MKKNNYCFKVNELADFREIPIDNFAYIGDAVIALKYKLKVMGNGVMKTRNITLKSINYISAKSHSKIMDNIYDSLKEEEKILYKRGKNSKGAKKRGNDEDYRRSTGFEALIGYLYLSNNTERLDEIFEVIDKCMYTEEMF